MKKIELLPKWYGKEERKDRSDKMKKALKELLESEVIPEKGKEKLRGITWNMDLFADTYSRNYEITIVNTYIDLHNSLTKQH